MLTPYPLQLVAISCSNPSFYWSRAMARTTSPHWICLLSGRAPISVFWNNQNPTRELVRAAYEASTTSRLLWPCTGFAPFLFLRVWTWHPLTMEPGSTDCAVSWRPALRPRPTQYSSAQLAPAHSLNCHPSAEAEKQSLNPTGREAWRCT